MARRDSFPHDAIAAGPQGISKNRSHFAGKAIFFTASETTRRRQSVPKQNNENVN